MTKTYFTSITHNDKFIGKANEVIILPKFVRVNKFNADAVDKFIEDFSTAEEKNDEIIPIIIDSYGGEVYSLLAMVDCIRSTTKKVATISVGKSMSCGAVLLTCGSDGYRFISPTSTVMIHDVAGGSWGKVEELKADAKEADRLNNIIYEIMEKNCGQKPGTFKKLVHDKGHSDWFLTTDECLKYKIANHARIPKFSVNINVEVDFG